MHMFVLGDLSGCANIIDLNVAHMLATCTPLNISLQGATSTQWKLSFLTRMDMCAKICACIARNLECVI